MNISTNLDDEHFVPDKPSNGYEWWYFDAISNDGNWSIVAIFYQGNPFSTNYLKGKYHRDPQNYPAVSISVYRKGKPEYYSFLEFTKSQFVWDDDDYHCTISGSSFHRTVRADEIEYELLLNQSLDSGHSISSKLKFISPRTSDKLIKETSKRDKHSWNLLQPRAKVVGSVKISGKTDTYHVGFSGNGYHDHNIGLERMSDSFRDWYWGRFHFDEATLIYYIMNGHAGKQHKAWLISNNNDEVLGYFDKIKLERIKKNILGLESYQFIELSGSLGDVQITQKQIVDNGPFYQRFLSEAIFNDVVGKETKSGISEYIRPRKIEDEKYWWMVHMRIRYMREQPHWVQKWKMFYEWTW